MSKTTVCPSCNAVLEDYASNYCPYCGTFLQSSEEQSISSLRQNAENLLARKEYFDAKIAFLTLTENTTDDYSIYYQLLRCLTHDFTYRNDTDAFKQELSNYLNHYKMLSSEQELIRTKDQINNYLFGTQTITKSINSTPIFEEKKENLISIIFSYLVSAFNAFMLIGANASGDRLSAFILIAAVLLPMPPLRNRLKIRPLWANLGAFFLLILAVSVSL